MTHIDDVNTMDTSREQQVEVSDHMSELVDCLINAAIEAGNHCDGPSPDQHRTAMACDTAKAALCREIAILEVERTQLLEAVFCIAVHRVPIAGVVRGIAEDALKSIAEREELELIAEVERENDPR